MKKIIYWLIIILVVVSGLLFANGKIKNEVSKKASSKPLTAAERASEMKRWEASPDGVKYKKWEMSPQGKKVFAGVAKIRRQVKDYTNMQAIVTSLSLPPGSKLGFGMMVKINGDDYILSFGPENSDRNLKLNNQFKQLHNLKVNDKIILKSHGVSVAPKYAYPIVSGDFVAQDGKIIYKHIPRKGGC
ncbi:hypothetical protein [Pedobacter boryungensis]|uniref:Uncharacterized protein n=1 Tax=Pedobacter boryungensis TaxID=869962 RepID=A0ABX2DAH3_9SPHI|nr:hypothetical protein [Pedobacter boryungensis]NQX31067.1 hypothetical protein [Pedobacter boryungensis]